MGGAWGLDGLLKCYMKSLEREEMATRNGLIRLLRNKGELSGQKFAAEKRNVAMFCVKIVEINLFQVYC